MISGLNAIMGSSGCVAEGWLRDAADASLWSRLCAPSSAGDFWECGLTGKFETLIF
jgi:hypothetical protein